jgi:transposase
VANIALTNGVNANQVFRWKRQYERGELRSRRSKPGAALVPVTLPSVGSVTIEFPGRALLSIEGAADPAVIRAVLESLAR